MASTSIHGETTTVPHASPPAAKVARKNPLPCYVVLVHGVNDVGEAYAPQEKGLCWGLAERLGRNHDLQPFDYVQPSERRDDKLVDEPDKIYYRRIPNADSYSPVIPFYWGFREEDGLIKNEKNRNGAKHRQWLDRCNNRIDKDGAKNGGAFVNAANCLPHMWADGWEPDLKVKLLNKVAPSPTHDLKRAPYRSYQVLAALRLAMVIRILRAHHPEAAINLVAHSMGCLVSLLAQAYLMEDGERPADTLVMNNPPYSFEENSLDAGLFQGLNQTSRARVETLKKIVKAFYENRAKSLAWGDLKNPKVGKGLAGRRWSPTQGSKKEAHSGRDTTFPERDNRGRTYLYFSPEDTTVALFNTQGIGWQGVPNGYMAVWTVQDGPRPQFATVSWNTLINDLEASAFRQRIFLAQQRAGEPFKVGLPPQDVSIRERGDTNGSLWSRFRHAQMTPGEGALRRINAEQLHPPIEFNPGPDLLPVSPIDAAIALAHGGSMDIEDIIDDPRPVDKRVPLCPPLFIPPGHWKPLKELLNQGKPPEQQFQHIRYAREILDEQRHPTGRILIGRDETPDETRLRWQSREMDENSHHSSIVSNHWHSQAVTAYDLALGRPIPWTEEEKRFYAYICEVADWRIKSRNPKLPPEVSDKLGPLKGTGFYEPEEAKNKALIEDTALYYVRGDLPPQVLAAKTAEKLSLIHFETTGKRGPAAG